MSLEKLRERLDEALENEEISDQEARQIYREAEQEELEEKQDEG